MSILAQVKLLLKGKRTTEMSVKDVVHGGYIPHSNYVRDQVVKRIPAQEGYRSDLDKNFRSKMEANFYRFITECHPDIKLIEFEPHWFTHRDGLPFGMMYLPDFRLTTHSGYQFYVEIKGVMDNRSQNALQAMKKYRPDVDIRLVGKEEYEAIRKRYAHKTKGWEE